MSRPETARVSASVPTPPAWRCGLGEIDIVAAEAGATGLTLVFCEVN